MPKRKYTPRVGQIFEDREKLLEKLEDSGWKFEGHSKSFSPKGKTTGLNLGVRDEKKDLWLMIDLIPYYDRVKVTRVKRLKISDCQRK